MLLCLWKHRLRLPAETLGILSVLPASTFFLSWCAPVVLECLRSSRVAFFLVRVDYSDFETGESILWPLSQPGHTLPSEAADLLCMDLAARGSRCGTLSVVMPLLQINLCSFPMALFCRHVDKAALIMRSGCVSTGKMFWLTFECCMSQLGSCIPLRTGIWVDKVSG